MRIVYSTIILLVSSISWGANITLDDLLKNIGDIEGYSTKVEYTVTQPMKEDDVKYNAFIEWKTNPGDTIQQCQTLIEYSLENNPEKSFECYFDGNFYRFDNGKFREYHWTHDSIPLSGASAVQRMGLFNELLPTTIIHTIISEGNNPASHIKFHPDTLINGNKANVVSIITEHLGSIVREINIVFDPKNNTPIYYERTNNIGQLAEQTMNARFSNTSILPLKSLSEQILTTKYPDIFSQYRISTYGVTQLKDKIMPNFSLPTSRKSRYQWSTPLQHPTILVFIDPNAGMTQDAMTEIRKATEYFPATIDVLWVVNTNNEDDIANISENLNNEQILTSGKRLASDCGITGFPTLLFINKDGKISDMQIGFNNELKDIVIQKATIAFQ